MRLAGWSNGAWQANRRGGRARGRRVRARTPVRQGQQERRRAVSGQRERRCDAKQAGGSGHLSGQRSDQRRQAGAVAGAGSGAINDGRQVRW
ncbi:unnamed protein product [Urochloa humidicola]